MSLKVFITSIKSKSIKLIARGEFHGQDFLMLLKKCWWTLLVTDAVDKNDHPCHHFYFYLNMYHKNFVFFHQWKKISKNQIFTVGILLHVNYNRIFPTQDTKLRLPLKARWSAFQSIEPSNSTMNSDFRGKSGNFIRLYNDTISEKH